MKLFVLYCVLASLFSCADSPTQKLTIKPPTQARLVGSSASPKESFKVKAKFVDFEVGDVEHYLFEDEQGEIWDFTKCIDKDFAFGNQLPTEKHNDFNQGWESNKVLQGRWFLLECGIRQQQLYPDGPEEIAQIIQDATLLY